MTDHNITDIIESVKVIIYEREAERNAQHHELRGNLEGIAAMIIQLGTKFDRLEKSLTATTTNE